MGRVTIRLGLILLVALATALPATLAAAQGGQGSALKPEALAGTYQGTATTPDGDMQLTASIKFEKGAFVGTIEHPQGPAAAITGGSLTGDRLVLNFDMGGTAGTITCTIKDPDHVEGTWTMGTGSGSLNLKRVAAADAAKPAATDKPAPAAADASKAATSADPITGQWDGVTGNSDMSIPFTMRLKLDGDKVSGDIASDQGAATISTGAWKDGALSISFDLGGAGTVTMVGSIQDGKLVGSLDVAGQMQMQWAAVRKQ